MKMRSESSSAVRTVLLMTRGVSTTVYAKRERRRRSASSTSRSPTSSASSRVGGAASTETPLAWRVSALARKTSSMSPGAVASVAMECTGTRFTKAATSPRWKSRSTSADSDWVTVASLKPRLTAMRGRAEAAAYAVDGDDLARRCRAAVAAVGDALVKRSKVLCTSAATSGSESTSHAPACMAARNELDVAVARRRRRWRLPARARADRGWRRGRHSDRRRARCRRGRCWFGGWWRPRRGRRAAVAGRRRRPRSRARRGRGAPIRRVPRQSSRRYCSSHHDGPVHDGSGAGAHQPPTVERRGRGGIDFGLLAWDTRRSGPSGCARSVRVELLAIDLRAEEDLDHVRRGRGLRPAGR